MTGVIRQNLSVFWRRNTHQAERSTARVAGLIKWCIINREKTLLFYPPYSPFPCTSLFYITCLCSHLRQIFGSSEIPWLHSWHQRLEAFLKEQNTMTITAPSPTCIHTYAQCLASTQFIEERRVNGNGAQQVQPQELAPQSRAILLAAIAKARAPAPAPYSRPSSPKVTMRTVGEG